MTAEAEYAAVPISVTVNGVKHDAVVEPRPEADWVVERPVAAAQPVYLVVRCTRA